MSESSPVLRHWRIDHDAQSIAALVLDRVDSSNNVLSLEVLEELDRALARVAEIRPHGLILRSGKPGIFSIGADLREFQSLADESTARARIERIHTIFQRLDDMDFPSVAVLNGHCLGAALELALCCRYRVAVNRRDVRIGLPEVGLGIHPGYGGTARLVRTIGARAAMGLMLAGRAVPPGRARKLGMIDRAVPAHHLQGRARRLLERRPPPRRATWWQARASRWPVRPLFAYRMRRRLAARVDAVHYPAPFALLDLWRRHGGDESRMLIGEARSAAQLVTSPTAHNLIRLCLLRSRLKSETDSVAAAQPGFHHVPVIGARARGRGIAAWCELQGQRVSPQDPDQGVLGRTRRIDRLSAQGRSSAGLRVNRILIAYLLEAVELVREGVPAAAVDEVAVAFGMATGPIELADAVGLDVCLSAARDLPMDFEDDVRALLSAKVDNGQLGKKRGRGFYQWVDGQPRKLSLPRGYRPADEIGERLILRFLNEALACWREAVLDDPDLLDAAIVFGTGFAPFCGGPLRYIRSTGQAALKDRLSRLARRFGARFDPDPGWDVPLA